MDCTLLRTALHKGMFCLYDEESCLRYNAQRKDAISWLKSRDKDEIKETVELSVG